MKDYYKVKPQLPLDVQRENEFAKICLFIAIPFISIGLLLMGVLAIGIIKLFI